MTTKNNNAAANEAAALFFPSSAAQLGPSAAGSNLQVSSVLFGESNPGVVELLVSHFPRGADQPDSRCAQGVRV